MEVRIVREAERLLERAHAELGDVPAATQDGAGLNAASNVERWQCLALIKQLEKAQFRLAAAPEAGQEAVKLQQRLEESITALHTKIRTMRNASQAFPWAQRKAESNTAPRSLYASLAAGLDGSEPQADEEDFLASLAPVPASAPPASPAPMKQVQPQTHSTSAPSVRFLPRPKPKEERPVRRPPEPQSKEAPVAHAGDEDALADEYDASSGLRHRGPKAAKPEDASDDPKHTYPPPPATQGDSADPTTATLLQSSRAAQDSLSGELLRMASVLKKNSLAFADALERDRKLVETAGEQLSGNLDLMTRTRGRLGEYSRMARGMGWMTFGCIVTVIVSWIWVFVLIKLT